MIYHFFRKTGKNTESCFYVAVSKPLTKPQTSTLEWLLSETFEPELFGPKSFLSGKVVELGPRMNFETAFSSNAVSICHACGLDKVTRLEASRRYQLEAGVNADEFIAANHDRMTECLYEKPLDTFETGIKPESVFDVLVLEKGEEALRDMNKKMGLGMDDWDIKFYTDMFRDYFKRNPTNVEVFQLGQANSEHSRHWFFKGQQVIDGKKMPIHLMDVVRKPLEAIKGGGNSTIAFNDNSSAIKGYDVSTILPKMPGQISPFVEAKRKFDILFTAETHNFPSGVAPFPGAETGTGGRIRDVQATGRGGLMVAGTAGFCTADLRIPGYAIPGENLNAKYPSNLASPLTIMLKESLGAWSYGNEIGEPVIQGFTRTFDLRLPNGERRTWLKPIMFTGGVGQMEHEHMTKGKPERGMLVVQVGGPAYRIGTGGGAASSMIQGANAAELDFNAVQRGNAEMEQKMNRVIRACVEMGENNPIISIHDQGAGGPCNVLTELVDPIGGRIEIREIKVGDKTMSVLEIWSAEYQERNALLIQPARIKEFQKICVREKVNCELLGEVTGDGQIVVHDKNDDSTPVNLELAKILGKVPQKTFKSDRPKQKLQPLTLPKDLTVESALKEVWKLPSVGGKGWLTNHVDRSVTGLIVQQQACGPLQLPVADVAVIAQTHFGKTGAAISVGEQPIKMLVDPAAGARMAVGESLTNMVWAKVSAIGDIRCSGNWMWAAKQPGEGAQLWDAANAMSKFMIDIGMAVDGGKDSLSMAAKVDDETVKAPGELVISAYATVADIHKVVTPDIKNPGKSIILFIDLAGGKNRMGGSALAQAHSQIGNESPDVDDPQLLKSAFNVVQGLVEKGLIMAGHDRSDGGLITTLAEMAMAGNAGMELNIPEGAESIPYLFSEELGLAIECLKENEAKVISVLNKASVPFLKLGQTKKAPGFTISQGKKSLIKTDIPSLLTWWTETGLQIEQLQIGKKLAEQEIKSLVSGSLVHKYKVPFSVTPTADKLIKQKDKPKVAIIREEGSNGDREMTSAFYSAGFEPWDVTMTDLLSGEASLDDFRGVVFVGGFSYADVLDSSKGWAGIIRFNPKLKKEFDSFYNRPDTFSLGVCNGCQLMALLGWIPWKGLPDSEQPRFIRNIGGRFESRWVDVNILKSPAIMLQGMEGSRLGVWVAHGEGRVHFPKAKLMEEAIKNKLVPMVFSGSEYPMNPNGSPKDITSLCSADGRHLAMMPHPERAFLTWQWPYVTDELRANSRSPLQASPWLKMFQNARNWCDENKAK